MPTQSQLVFSHINVNTSAALDPLPGSFDNPGVLALDVEHDGLGEDAVPVGVSLAVSDREWYWPFNHPEGRQHQPEQVRTWLKDHLDGAEVAFLNVKNDIAVLRRWGLDLEKIGVRPREVQHAAALLDDSRRHFALDILARDKFGAGKIKAMYEGKEVPPAEIPKLPAQLAAPYARRDARLTWDLHQAYAADIEAQDMTELLEMEDSLIYCVLHMEREKVFLDVPKLVRWRSEVRDAYSQRILELFRRTGLRINPNSPDDMVKMFLYLGHSFGHTLKGSPTFTDVFLQKHIHVKEIQLCVEARHLSSLLSKYLDKYYLALTPDGRLPYQLHQLRADDYGTITGRFASSKVNIQQVFKPDKQLETHPCTAPWIVRELFIPGQVDGFNLRLTVHDEANGDLNGKWLHADASQIEYRLFAHFSSVPAPYSTRLIDAYNNDPNLSYHKFVHKELLKECMIYSHAKNFNFMKLYGGGIDRAMDMLGWGEDRRWECQRLLDQYDRALPEAKRLLNYVTKLAEQRGYVRTILNRRRRYVKGDRFYSGLNSVLQGGAADLMKLKLIKLYKEMKNIKNLKHAEEVFAVQEYPLRVPITWEVSEGKNWRDAA